MKSGENDERLNTIMSLIFFIYIYKSMQWLAKPLHAKASRKLNNNIIIKQSLLGKSTVNFNLYIQK